MDPNGNTAIEDAKQYVHVHKARDAAVRPARAEINEKIAKLKAQKKVAYGKSDYQTYTKLDKNLDALKAQLKAVDDISLFVLFEDGRFREQKDICSTALVGDFLSSLEGVQQYQKVSEWVASL